MDEEKPVEKSAKDSSEENHSAEKSSAKDGSEQKLDEVLARLGHLESAMRAQLSRLYDIEQRLGITPPMFQQPATRPTPTQRRPIERPPLERPPAPPTERATRPTAGHTASPTSSLPTQPTQTRAPYEASRQMPFPLPPPPQMPRPAPKKGDLESRIGGNWLAIIGVVAVVFGMGFFLKYAFESGWITPLYRVVTGVIVGIGFLAGGETLRKKYAGYAYGLTGGGILILYLSIWSSFRLYHLLPRPTPAFVFMALVTATAVLLAARYNAKTIAILGLFGGFLTPILLSTNTDNQIGLFTYIVLLDLGVLALAFRKQWRVLNYLTFAATVLMSFSWYLEWYKAEKALTTVFFFSLLFAIFALVAVIYNVLYRRPTTWLDLTLVFLNALLYFASSYGILSDSKQAGRYQAYLGLFAVLMASFYGALGFFTYKRDREDRLLLLTFSGLAFLFLVLAVPIQFDQQWVTMAWAIEGAVMTYVGLRAKDRTSLYAALVVFGIAAYHWFVIDAMQFAYRDGETFTPLLNPRALSCGVLVASLFAASFLYKRLGAHVADEERSMFGGAYLLGANVFAVTLLSMDANSYFEQKRALALAAGNFEPHDYNLKRLDNSLVLTLTALWSLYGAVALFVGVVRKLVVVRAVALLLLALVAAKVLVIDLWYYDAEWHRTVFNQTFMSFAFVVGALAFAAWLYSRSTTVGQEERVVIVPLLVGAANLLALVAMSAEVIGHYDRILASSDFALLTVDVRYLEAKKHFVINFIWTVYGAAALFTGLWRKSKAIRFAALGLLGFTALKTLFINLGFVREVWHESVFNYTFASFALLILALATAVRLYSRDTEVEPAERSMIQSVLTVAANLLAIIALSAEAWAYYHKALRATGIADAAIRNLRFAQKLSLSVVWTVYGGVLLTVGILQRRVLLRLMALLLLALTIVKVFFYDLAELEDLYRFISFGVLGAILLAVSFLYNRFRRFIFDSGEDESTKAST